jgi:hypothetical protein
VKSDSRQLEAARHAVEVAERRLKELDSKPKLTRAEQFEREMTLDCIKRGKAILK